jgi:hypothetical protein
MDCSTISSLPNLDITIGGTLYSLEPEFYILKETILGHSTCIFGIMGMDFPP